MAPPNDADDITMTPAVTDIPKDSAAGDKSKSSDSEKKDKDPKADEAGVQFLIALPAYCPAKE